MNEKQFKKKYPTAWEIRFEELKKHFFVEDVKQFISDEIAKAKQEGAKETLRIIEDIMRLTKTTKKIIK